MKKIFYNVIDFSQKFITYFLSFKYVFINNDKKELKMSTFSNLDALYEDFLEPNSTEFDEKAIGHAIKNILKTHLGTMPGRPDFGSRILEIPFSQNDTITQLILKEVVEEALKRWESRVIFRDVKILSNELNNLVAKIEYYYRDTGINGSLSISLLE